MKHDDKVRLSFHNLLHTELRDVGMRFQRSADEIFDYIQRRATALEDIQIPNEASDVEYLASVNREARNVLLFASLEAVENADQVDERAFVILKSSLIFAISLL